MITTAQLDDVVGATAYDRDGDKIGKVGHVYFDDQTDQPKWVTVNTGLFGTNESFVPVPGAELSRRPGHPGLRQGHGQGRPERRRGRPPVPRGGAAALPLLRPGQR